MLLPVGSWLPRRMRPAAPKRYGSGAYSRPSQIVRTRLTSPPRTIPTGSMLKRAMPPRVGFTRLSVPFRSRPNPKPDTTDGFGSAPGRASCTERGTSGHEVERGAIEGVGREARGDVPFQAGQQLRLEQVVRVVVGLLLEEDQAQAAGRRGEVRLQEVGRDGAEQLRDARA